MMDFNDPPGNSTDKAALLEAAIGHFAAGRLDAAAPMVERLLVIDGSHAAANGMAGLLAFQTGDVQRAHGHFSKAVAGEPENTDFQTNLGLTYQAMGQLDKAIAAFRTATQCGPSNVQAFANLGFALRQTGDLIGALENFVRANQIDPAHVGAHQGWVSLLGRIETPSYNSAIAEQLLRALNSPLSYYDNLSVAVANQLVMKYGIGGAGAAAIEFSSDDPLLAAYLSHCLNIHQALEHALMAWRRQVLLDGPDAMTPETSRLTGLLARQACINEYAFFIDEGETAAIQALVSANETALSRELSNVSGLTPALLINAMYAPLHELSGATQLAGLDDAALGDDLAPLVELTVRDYLQEQEIKTEIAALREIEDKTSQAVRGQYEEHPYPRWIHVPKQISATPAVMLSQMFPHFSPPAFLDGEIQILIAGCGTGQHTAVVAMTHPDSDILAIDLSLASMAYAQRMAGKLDIGNLTFMHADILDAGSLDRQFDMIQSVGVLHHMRDPLAGWRVLSGLLRPGGVMKLGLYSERGRPGVIRSREIIAEEGIGSSDQDIRAFRQRLMTDPPAGDFTKIMSRADFYSTSMVRDLLFHVQEVNYTPARLKDEIDELELRFIGFEETEELGLNDLYRQMFPGETRLDNLENWETLEQQLDDPPEGYVFWCQKPMD